MRVVRRLTAAVLVALVAAACSPQEVGDTVEEIVTAPGPDAPAGGDPVEAPVEEPAPPADGADQPSEDEGGEPSQVPPADSDAGSPEPADPTEAPAPRPQLTPVRDGGPVGANGVAYLRGDRARVVLEVDVQEGANLPQGALEHVRGVLDRESDAAVELVRGVADVPRRDAWTVDQLASAAAATRSVAHGDDVAVLHLLVLRDGFEDDGVLGLAFDSSTAVVFPDQWSSLAGLLLSGDRIARAVTTHEVGHLLGLVGLVEDPTSDHEDPEHPGHTTDSDDVMYWAVETDLIGSLDGVPDDFGPATRADLAALRDG